MLLLTNTYLYLFVSGASRRFQIRSTPTHKADHPPVLHEIATKSGSFIGMSYAANLKYQHGVAPFDGAQGDEDGACVSIVFRLIKNVLDSDQVDEKVATYHVNLDKQAVKKQAQAVKKQAKNGAVFSCGVEQISYRFTDHTSFITSSAISVLVSIQRYYWTLSR